MGLKGVFIGAVSFFLSTLGMVLLTFAIILAGGKMFQALEGGHEESIIAKNSETTFSFRKDVSNIYWSPNV